MPKIFEYFGFIFFFYSNEHEPIHVHVLHRDCGTVFDLIIENGELKEIQEREAHGMDALSPKDNKTARRFIENTTSELSTSGSTFSSRRRWCVALTSKYDCRMALTLYITQAQYEGGHTLSLSFSDGTRQSIDFAPFFRAHPHPQYNKYFDEKHFKKFRLDHGNVVWGKNWDLMFPITSLHSKTL